jgi:hypothetical protein
MGERDILMERFFKEFFIFSLILFPLTCFAQKQQKTEINDLIEKYFSVNPEELSMAELVKALEVKAGVSIDTIINRTDTSLFYLRGYSGSFNPFRVSSVKTEFQIREAVVRNDRKIPVDTFLIMQIIVITDSTEKSKRMIRGELKRIDKEMNLFFPKSDYIKSRKKAKWFYETYSYKEGNFSPLPKIRVGLSHYYQDLFCYTMIMETYYEYLPK